MDQALNHFTYVRFILTTFRCLLNTSHDFRAEYTPTTAWVPARKHAPGNKHRETGHRKMGQSLPATSGTCSIQSRRYTDSKLNMDLHLRQLGQLGGGQGRRSEHRAWATPWGWPGRSRRPGGSRGWPQDMKPGSSVVLKSFACATKFTNVVKNLDVSVERYAVPGFGINQHVTPCLRRLDNLLPDGRHPIVLGDESSL